MVGQRQDKQPFKYSDKYMYAMPRIKQATAVKKRRRDQSDIFLVDIARIALALRIIKSSPIKAPGGPVVIRVATRNHQLHSFWSAPDKKDRLSEKKNTSPDICGRLEI